jgi:hypothetical protein
MTTIANLFSNLYDSSKKKSITDSAMEYKNHKFNKYTPTPALSQGDKFKRYQNKIKKNLEKNINVNTKEGFGTNTSLTQQSKNILSETDISSQASTIANLKKQYAITLEKYKKILAANSKKTSNYLQTVSPSNPYLNQVIAFTSGECCAVTNQGVVKYIPTWEAYTNATGITNPKIIYLDIPMPNNFWTPGTVIPTTPPLISGTTLTGDQSLGNEGYNVFVDTMVNKNVSTTYQGCYADNTTSPTMTFVGGAPPQNAGIQNGNFGQPTYASNTYIYITDSSTVPGWTFNNGVMMNNSSAWGYFMPYPNGDQAACIQSTASISQTFNTSVGTYNLSFWCCGRPNYSGSNTIDVQLNGTTVQAITPPVNVWTSYTVPLSIATTGSNTITFLGTINNVNNSSAIQGVVITLTGTSSTQGTYTYSMCEQAATNGGYQYFALQNVNSSTATGYCAVSNDYVSATQYGNSEVVGQMVTLWSSNTGSNVGVSATLTNEAALSVINSSGASVYSSPNSTAQPNNYLGCYGDKSKRAMTLYNNGAQSYDLSGCQQIAEQNNYSFFGLQNSTSGTNAQCTLSNNFSQAGEYGPAGNCTQISDGSWSGGGWSNAVYQTSNPSSYYYLILQDDGNMCVYRGTGPNNNQGLIWATGTNGQTQAANPTYAAANGVYGQNYITSGSTLAAGDFVGSTSGNMALIMQSDGNLVLYTFTMVSNCQTMSDGNTGAGVGGNALYQLSEVGIPGNIGKVGYVDANSELFDIPSSNLQKSTNYLKMANMGVDYNNINWSTVIYDGIASQPDCQNYCDENGDCTGYSYYNSNGACIMFTPDNLPPTSPLTSQSGTDTYLNIPEPITVPDGASNKVVSTDTLTFQNYVNGGTIGNEYGLAKLTSVEQQQISQLEDQLQSLSNQIANLTNTMGNNDSEVNKQLNTNNQGAKTYLTELKNNNLKIANYSSSLDNILNDSDIVVLQKNYDYLFWSILAVGVLLVSMNVVKK